MRPFELCVDFGREVVNLPKLLSTFPFAFVTFRKTPE